MPDVLGYWVVLLELRFLSRLSSGAPSGAVRSSDSKRSAETVRSRGSQHLGRGPIAQMIPWTTLAWTQVHHGQLPLWNPYSGLGMPLAFNWQSAPFGLPALVGYLFPVQMPTPSG